MAVTEEELIKMGKEYQDGADYPPEAKESEDNYIYENILNIVEKCKEMKQRDPDDAWPMSLEDHIGCERGSWQVSYGFYRSMSVIQKKEEEEIQRNTLSVTEEAYKMFGKFQGDLWLEDANYHLGGSSPIKLIKSGRAQKVLNVLNAIKEGYLNEP